MTDSYGARDVLNAPAIKVAIKKRSVQRQDRSEISAWLVRHLFRYIVGNIQVADTQLIRISSLQQAKDLLRPQAPPEWMMRRLKALATTELWWIDPAGADILVLEVRLLEFLQSRQGTPLEGKLMRVNCFQALELSAREHAIFESKAAIGWREHSPDAVRTVYQGMQGEFVELLADSKNFRAEMVYESQIMRHCLGQFSDKRKLSGGYGEHYAESCETGKMRLFSYRKGQSQPSITISVIVETDGKLLLEQIKGKQNKPPISRYADEIVNFLNSLNTSTETVSDAVNMGLVRNRDGWCKIADVDQEIDQLQIVKTHPVLFKGMLKPTRLVQWVMAAEYPELLEHASLTPSITKAIRGA